MAEYPLTDSDLRGVNVYWLLTIDFAGRQFRWATDAVEIVNADGDYLDFKGGLDVSYGRVFDLFDLSPSGGVSIRGLQFPDDVDLALLYERGYRLERSRAEISVWIPGRTWEKRRVMMIGRVSLPDYGGIGEDLSFTIQPESSEDNTVFPAPRLYVNRRRWTGAADPFLSKHYVTVFGQPGFVGIENGSFVSAAPTGSPAYYVASNTLTIAGHHVRAPTVAVYNATKGTKKLALATNNTTDALGREVATVDISSWVGTNDPQDDYYVAWLTGGGLPGPEGPAMRGAGDIMEYMMSQSTMQVDYGRFQAIKSELNAYKIDCCINEPVGPWSWCVKHLLPLMPVSIVAGPDGHYPVLWRPDAAAADAVADLVAGEGLTRNGLVQIDRGKIANELSISYSPLATSNDYRYTRTVTGGPIEAGDTDTWTAQHVKASRLAYGELRAKPIKTKIVYDQATADRILMWKSRAMAFATRSVKYDNPSGEWAWLEPGAVVTITDDELHWASKVAIVRGIEWRGTLPSVTLTIIDDPARDSRTL